MSEKKGTDTRTEAEKTVITEFDGSAQYDGEKAGKKKSRVKLHGMRMGTLNIVLIVVSVLFAVLLIFSTVKTTLSYRELEQATDRYIICQKSAKDMQDASDELTDDVRIFSVNFDINRLFLYFKEADETRRRENAITSIESLISPGSQQADDLRRANSYSQELMNIEYYSMKLILEAKKELFTERDLARVPERVTGVQLSEEDAALDPDAKVELARSMLFDDQYFLYKYRITMNVNQCLEELLKTNKQERETSSGKLMGMLRQQEVLIIIMMIIIALIVGFSTVFVILPMSRSVAHIEKQEKIPLIGSREMQTFARSYNIIFEESRMRQEQLSYEATHDPLTGLNNRGVFQKVISGYRERNLALLLIDVDYFKDFNDNYGHEVGDAILKKVSKLLKSRFRSEDYICRVGGDEFAVIMLDATEEFRDLIETKIRYVLDKLKMTEDNLPVATLSVGVSFSHPELDHENLYKNADMALYSVKNSGRNGIAFFRKELDHGE